jgi:hypothetical protein
VSSEFGINVNKIITIIGYLVHIKRTKTKSRVEQEMFFGTFMDADGQLFDSVHFPLAARQYPFKGKGMYFLRGKISEDFGHLTLETTYMAKLPYAKLAGG